MATGTITVFQEFSKDLSNGVHNFGSDTFKYAIIDNTSAPTAADATPRWADYSGNEVSGTGYTANGQALDNTAVSEAAGVTTIDFDDEVFLYNGAGFQDGYWGIIFNDTATNDEAVAFQELGGPVSARNGNVTVGPNASGFLTVDSS